MKRILPGILFLSLHFTVLTLKANAGGWDLSGDGWVSPSKQVPEKPSTANSVDPVRRQVKPAVPAESATRVPAEHATAFDMAIQAWEVRYSLHGLNNDTEMLLTLRNLTAQDISLRVPQGVVFVPARSSVQRMLLRAAVPFAVPAGKSVAKRVPVLCMDIAKSPPSIQDTAWTHSFDDTRSRLVAYTRQAAGEEASRRSDATQDQIERFFLRFVLWRYNGASQEDFASLIRKYGTATEKETATARSVELIRMADTIIAGFRRNRNKQGGQ